MSTNEPTETTPNPEPTESEVIVEPGVEAAGAAAEQAGAKADQADKKPEPPPPDFREIRIQTLERALADREATLHSYIRAHKKAEADFEAYKQRLERDRQRELLAEKARFVERLLDLDDNLARTIEAAKRTAGANEALISGVEMVHRQFVERLVELGLERVDPTGKPFDPTSMEALGMMPVNDPTQDNTVVLTMRTGYRIGEREIRPALVQVGRFLS